MLSRVWFLIALLLALFQSALAKPVVYLATMAPGAEFWERFGHNELIIMDAPNPAVGYSFGEFDFTQKNFIVNFARGKMAYRGVRVDGQAELQFYIQTGRAVWLQALNLTDAQTAKLQSLLDDATTPENSVYRYDYFRANCSTRLRDALNAALDGALEKAALGRSHGHTFRSLGLAHAQSVPWMYLGIHAGLGADSDRPLGIFAELFIPANLRALLETMQTQDAAGNDVPMIASTQTFGDTAGYHLPARTDLRWCFLITGLLLAIVIAAGFRFRQRASLRMLSAFTALMTSVFMGMAGVVLLGLWMLTDHVDAARNLNLTYFCPLLIFTWPSLIGSFKKTWRPSARFQRAGIVCLVLACLGTAVKVLPAVRQQNIEWALLCLPILLALVFAGRINKSANVE